MKPVTVGDCGKGVNKDLLASELAPGVWSDASNVRFRNGFAEKRKGTQEAFTTPTATPYWIKTFSTATARFLVQAGTATVFVDDGSTRTDITGTPPTGGRDDRWTGGDFNGVFVCNNGVDAPMYWNGNIATNLATVTAWPGGEKADTFRPFKDWLVAGAVTIGGTKYPYRVKWSNAAEPGALPTAWAAADTNDAGDKDLVGCGHIVDFLQLGDVNIIYCQEGRFAMQWIGGNQVFSFTRLPGRDGLMARGCVAQTPKGHVFLSAGDVMLHNGGEASSIADGRIRQWLNNTMDTTNSGRSFLAVNPQESEVWIVFPSTGQTDCNNVAAWNWNDDTWGLFTVSGVTYGTAGLVSSGISGSWSADTETWDQDVTTWDQDPFASNQARLILSTSTSKIGLANTGSLDFGSRISWYLEKSGISLGDTDTVKVISRSRPHINAVAGTQVTIKHAATMNPNDTPVFENSSTFTVGTSTFANQFASGGRYGAIRIEGADDQAVALRSYEIEFAGSGGRF